MNGFLNLNKPSSISSNAVLYAVKKQLPKGTKVGHLGTLDPLANGVLPVAIGKATKLFDLLLNKTKTYVAQFTFGEETDTLDCEGKIIKHSNLIPSQLKICAELQNFVGVQNQIPPQYSAKNINGHRAYDLARQGVDFELQPKEIEIFKFELVKQISEKTFEFKIECSSGTYIRSIARDLAYKLNTFAFMNSLTRTKSGYFEIDSSIDPDKINIEKDLIDMGTVLDLKKIYISSDNSINALKNGMNVKIFEENCENVCVYACQNLLGIGKIESGYIKLTTHLC